MKTIKIVTALLLILSSTYMIYSGPCMPLAKHAMKKASEQQGGKISAFKPRRGVFSSTRGYGIKKRPSFASSQYTFNSNKTISKLRKQHKQLKEDLDRLELALLNFEQSQKEKAITQSKFKELLEEIKKDKSYREKIKQPEKEAPEVATSKIPESVKFKFLEKESEIR